MLGTRVQLDTRKAEANAANRNPRGHARKFSEQLKKRIQELHEQLLNGRVELHMTPENVQAVVETALEFAQQPTLQKRMLADPHGKHEPIEVFDVLDLTGSWGQCLKGLAHPLTAQRRPIVFDHALAQGRDDVVLAHLNHMLVTMSLRLLRAEIWSGGSERGHLHRVTARVVRGTALDTPAVIAHARLLVLGNDNQRLHEELIAAGGYLRLGEFVRMNQGQLREALDMQAPGDRLAPAELLAQLQAQWEKQREKLVQTLEVRMRERSSTLQKTLADRAAREQQDIRAVLTELQTHILQEVRQATNPQQLTMEGFSSEEQQQFERDIAFLEERARQIDHEIEQEVARIQQRYADPQPRLFPVTVTYLIPERLTR